MDDNDPRRKTKDAFTLIELLISVSISSVIILSLYSTFHTGLLSYNRLNKSLSSYQTARKIFNRMDLDLRNVFAYSNEEVKFKGDKSQIGFLTLVGESFSSVSYKKEGEILFRFCKKGIESLKEDSAISQRILAKGIKEIEFSYGFITDDDRIDWKDDWGEDDKKKLPIAVKIRLILKERIPKEERDIKFEKDIYFPLAE